MTALGRFKGTISRDGYDFLMTGMVGSRPKKMMRPVFRCSNDFITKKVHFLWFHASLQWLNNARRVNFVQFSLLFISQQGLQEFFTLAGGLCKFYASAREKTTNTALNILGAIQATSQSTFISAQVYST